MSDSCDPMDCVACQAPLLGILQARILEWVAISFSKEGHYTVIKRSSRRGSNPKYVYNKQHNFKIDEAKTDKAERIDKFTTVVGDFSTIMSTSGKTR